MIACAQVRERLWPALDGELDDAESAALAAHLRGCAGCSAELAVAVATHRRLCEGCAAGAPAVDAVRRRRWPLAAASAAALLVAAMLVHRAWQRAPVAVVAAYAGEARAGGAPIAVGDAVRRGEALATLGPDSALTLAYADGTRVTLAGDTAVDAFEAAPKRLRLAHGAVRAEVAPQPAGRPMALTTGGALAEVVGTRFALSVDDAGTRLVVDDGRVRLVDRASGAAVVVGAGHDARVAPGVALVERPIAAPVWRAGGEAWRVLDGLVARSDADGLAIAGSFARGWDFAFAPVVAIPLPAEGVDRLSVRLRVDRCDGHAQALYATCAFRDAAGADLGKAVTPAYDAARLGTWQTLTIDFPPPPRAATIAVMLTRDPPAPTALALTVGEVALERLRDETGAPRWRWDFAGGAGDWRAQEATGDMTTVEADGGERAPDGAASIRCHGRSSDRWTFALSGPRRLAGGRRYRLSAWLRVDAVTPPAQPLLKCEMWGWADAPPPRRALIEGAAGYDLARGGWQRLSVDVAVDARHPFADVELVKGVPGDGEIDARIADVVLEPLPAR